MTLTDELISLFEEKGIDYNRYKEINLNVASNKKRKIHALLELYDYDYKILENKILVKRGENESCILLLINFTHSNGLNWVDKKTKITGNAYFNKKTEKAEVFDGKNWVVLG